VAANLDGVTAPYVIVLFGATGDLAKRKLLPGLLRLTQAGLLPEARIVGTSLEEIDTEEFVRRAYGACEEFGHCDMRPEPWARFASTITYVPQSRGPHELAEAVHKAEADLGANGNIRLLHYLSVPPKAALDVIHELHEAGLVARSRVVMEKPFGTDLASAIDLNARVHQTFDFGEIARDVLKHGDITFDLHFDTPGAKTLRGR